MHIRGSTARAAVESLETRRHLSVSVVAKKATLNVVGTAGDDYIVVRAHRSLINFVNVVIKNAAGREDVLVATGRFTTIKVDALGGNDEIAIDASLRGLAPDVTVWLDGGSGNDRVTACSLPGTIALRDGNDTAKLTSSERLTINGDAGNDRLEIGAGAHELNGGDGNDSITAGDGAQAVRGGAGNDLLAVGVGFGIAEGNDGNDDLRVPSGQNKTADAGAGDDRVTLFVPAGKLASGASTSVLGGTGDDKLYGSKHGDVLSGGEGDDRLYAAKGARGGDFNGNNGDDLIVAASGTGSLQFTGGAGDDILDARGSTGAVLSGGTGNDDLYAGTETIGKGEDGRDWFSDSDWKEKDQDEDDIQLGGSPNSGWYGSTGSVVTNYGGGWLATGGTIDGIGFTTRIELRRLDDVGFVTTATTGSETAGARTVATVSSLAGTSEQMRVSPALLAAERKGLRAGVVRLPAGWQLDFATRRQGDVVWYDVRFGTSGDQARTNEFGNVYQLCVKAGTVVLSSDGAYTSDAGRIARARADLLVMSIAPGSVARVAGDLATYRVSGDVLDAAKVAAPKDRHGILVDGGAIWLAAGDASTTFIAST